MTGWDSPAYIDDHKGRQWWRCPGCKALLAEVSNDALRIKVGGRQMVIVFVEAEQICGKCGRRSVLTRKEQAA